MTITLSYGTFELPDSDAEAFGSAQGEGFWDLALKEHLDAIPAGAVAVDVGAHVGLYTCYLSTRGVHVEAVEGHPAYQELLRQNVRAHRERWRQAGVGKINIWHCFAYSRSTVLEEVSDHRVAASNTWVPVPRVSSPHWGHPLDDLVLHLPIHTLKVDAQGADLHVLLGAKRIIERWHPQILIEYEASLAAKHGHTVEDYRRWITEHNYEEHSIDGLNVYLTWNG